MTRLKQSHELMRRVREMVLGHHEGEVIETTPIDAHVLILYSRVRSLLEGACVLLDARLPEEAVILGREMFTDSLHLMEIATQAPDRAPLVLGLVSKSLTEMQNLQREAASLGVSNKRDVDAVLGVLAERRKEIDAYRRRHGIGNMKSFRHEKQLASDHGRLDGYLDFAFVHRMVHRADMAQAGRTVRTDEVVRVCLRNPDDDFLVAASAFVMTSALHAHKAVAPIFAWTETEPEEIDRLLAEIDRLFSAELHSPGGNP
jgi:hypothetical protein